MLHPCDNPRCPDKARNPSNRHRTPQCPYRTTPTPTRFAITPPVSPPQTVDPFDKIARGLRSSSRDRTNVLVPIKDFNVSDIPVGDEMATHVLTTVEYDPGGHSYRLDRYVRRGYYISVQAVRVTGENTYDAVPGSGHKTLLKETSSNQRWARRAAYEVVTPRLIGDLVQHIDGWAEAHQTALDLNHLW